MKKLIIVMTTLLYFSCASTHPGNYAAKIKAPDDLTVSIFRVDDYSDSSNYFYDVTFESKTAKWIRFELVDLDFETVDNVAHNLVIGRDLETWAKSMELKKRISEQNEYAGLTAIVLGGLALAVAGTSGKNSTLAGIGAGTAVGGAAYGVARDLDRDRDKAQISRLVPEDHILVPFSVPSNGIVKRWFLVNLPDGRIATYASLKVKTIDGEEFIYRLPLTENGKVL